MSVAAHAWLIGTDPDCDIVVHQPGIAGRHCVILQNAAGWFVDDLNSDTGSFLGRQRITSRVAWDGGVPLVLAGRVLVGRPSQAPQRTRLLLTIGSDLHNDIVLKHSSVAPRHAFFRVTATESLLEDLQSLFGTFIGGRRLQGNPATIYVSDQLRFGDVDLSAADLFETLADPRHEYVTIRLGAKPSATLGSARKCDYRIGAAGVADEHARITPAAGGYVIEDLQTATGTHVNKVRITRRTPIRQGDVITLGECSFVPVFGDNRTERTTNGLAITATDICVDVPGKRLLSGISLSLQPGELTGLMGMSGAGKTTLISVLNGYVAPSTGRVSINAASLHDHFELFQERIGYVPQDDIVHESLTVGLALFYSARLRLPESSSDEEVQRRVEAVANRLGLMEAMNVLIGSAVKKGISGGQRKRVNLAMELINEPSILFLDEPTSGLSSEDTMNVMRLLRQLADEGQTILITIHQPSADAFQLLDNLIVLASDKASAVGGRLVFFGPAYPDSIDFFRPSRDASHATSSPDDVLRGANNGKVELWAERYQRSDYFKTYVADRAAANGTPTGVPARRRKTWWKSFSDCLTLVQRSISVKIRDRWNTTILMLQAPVIGCLIALAFGKRARSEMTPDAWHDVANATTSVVFLLVLSAIWFGCSNAAREIVGEWAIYIRERMVNLAVVPYLASKIIVLGGLCIVQCSALLLIGYATCGLKCPWYLSFGILMLSALCGIGLGLVVSAFSRSSEMAIACLPLVILPMVILGGVLQPLKEMNEGARTVAQWTPSRWAFEALLLAEAGYRPKFSLPLAAVEVSRPRPSPSVRLEDVRPQELILNVEERDLGEASFPQRSYRIGIAMSTAVLTVMAVLCVFVTALILRARDIR